MPTAQITNPTGAFSSGGTWGNPSFTVLPSEVERLLNGTGQTLYTGDIVSLDYTGVEVILPATGNLTQVIGVVGGGGNAEYPPTTTTGATPTVTTNTFPT